MRISNKKIIFGVVILIYISTPVIFYFINFNIAHSLNANLSNKNADWGAFGSYISGIYSTIFSALTIVLLYQQNKTQRLIIEQTDALRIREEASFNLKIIDDYLKGDSTLLKYLVQFSKINDQNIDSIDDELLKIATQIDNSNSKILRAWIGFNISLLSLKNYKDTSFEYHFTCTKLLPVTLFGFETCVALDNFCYIKNKKFPLGEYSNFIKNQSA